MVGIACLVVASVGLWNYLRITQQGKSMPDTEILTKTVETPGEKDPGKISDEYKVPDDQPRAIVIPNLNIESYIQRVGIDQHNTLVAPDSIFFGGWYLGSVAPGEEGISIIDGHVSGRYEDGIFRHLADLKNDDMISIQMGDSTWRDFLVKSVKVYSVEESAKALFNKDSVIKNELRLITCDGVFDKNTQTYDKRLIVSAELKNNQ